MKKALVGLLFLVLLAAGQARAEICTIDDVPAATLLLPYFEVDLDDASGITTLFSINNASAVAHLAHVTLWTDESCPTLDFDVFLTGFDVVTLNLRDVFNGILPRTADSGIDPDPPGIDPVISNQGSLSLPDLPATPFLSGDADFPGSTGPCGSISTVYPAAPTPALSAALIAHLRALHTGKSSPVYGACCGLNYGDNIARGYITVDSVNQCNLEFVASAGYFAPGGTGIANNRNVLWGDYFYVDSHAAFAQGETLVHIEACPSPSVGQGADECDFVVGDYTFYGRYVSGSAVDQREPLASNFSTRYVNGAGFPSGTELVVWRDNTLPLAALTHSCATGRFPWVPLNQADVVAFDEAENPEDLCFQGDNISPPTGGTETCFPVEAQRVSLKASIVPFGASPTPSAPFGWMFLNLNTTVAGGLFPGRAQAWVTTGMSAFGVFSVGYDAVKLDTMCDNLSGGVLLLP